MDFDLGFVNLQIPDLKPVFLEKEATMIEVNHWIEQFINQIIMGYRNCPPQREVSVYLGPLIHLSWPQSIDDKDPKIRAQNS